MACIPLQALSEKNLPLFARKPNFRPFIYIQTQAANGGHLNTQLLTLLFLIFSTQLCLCEYGDKRPEISQSTPQIEKKTNKISLGSAFLRKRRSSLSSKQASRHTASWESPPALRCRWGKRLGSRGPSCMATYKHVCDRNKENPTSPWQPKVYFPSLALAARPCLTPLYQGAGQAGSTGSSPSPRQQAPPFGQVEARLGCGPTSAGPMTGQDCGQLEMGPAVASVG